MTSTTSPSYSLPGNPHPTHRLPLPLPSSSNNLDIPPFKPPSEGGPPRRLSTGGFPSVFTLPGNNDHPDKVEGLGIRGAEMEDHNLKPTATTTSGRASKKRKSDPKGGKDDSTTTTNHSPSPPSISPRHSPPHPFSSSSSSASAAKRPRTSIPSLDSLATTASNILSQSSSSNLGPPSLPPRAASYSNSHASSPIGLSFADPKQAETVQVAMGVREQQMREIERRRLGSTVASPSTQGGVTGLNNALGKLRAGKDARDKSSSSSAAAAAQGQEKEEGGLGARRGGDAREKTRNMTIVPTGYGGEASLGGLRSAPAKVAGPSSSSSSALATTSSSARPSHSAYPTYRDQPSPREPAPQQAYRRTSASAASGPSWAGYSPSTNGHRGVHVPTPLHASHTTQQGQRYPAHQLPNPSSQSQSQSQGGGEGSPPTHSSHSHHHQQQQYVGPAQYYYPPPPPPPSGGGGPLSPNTRYDPRIAPPPPPPAPSSSSSSSSSSSKAQFLNLFSTFYDTLLDSRQLARTLEGQMGKSSALLETLSSSSQKQQQQQEVVEGRMVEVEEMMESRLEEKVKEMVRRVMGEEREELGLQRRLARLEGLLGGGQSTSTRRGSGSGRGGTKQGGETREGEQAREEGHSVLRRLERLERVLEAREVGAKEGEGESGEEGEKETEGAEGVKGAE